jgi:hypothetical protein
LLKNKELNEYVQNLIETFKSKDTIKINLVLEKNEILFINKSLYNEIHYENINCFLLFLKFTNTMFDEDHINKEDYFLDENYSLVLDSENSYKITRQTNINDINKVRYIFAVNIIFKIDHSFLDKNYFIKLLIFLLTKNTNGRYKILDSKSMKIKFNFKHNKDYTVNWGKFNNFLNIKSVIAFKNNKIIN